MNDNTLASFQPSVEYHANDRSLEISANDDVSEDGNTDNNGDGDGDGDGEESNVAATFSLNAATILQIGADDASLILKKNTENLLHKIESSTSTDFLKKSRHLVSWRTRKQTTTNKIFGDCLRRLENGEKVDMEAVASLLKSTIEEQTLVQESRGKGWKKAGHWITTFAHNLSILLSSISSIVSVVKGIDDQFGGAVYGALSVLLMVAYNKRRKEILIDTGLVDIHKSIPRLEAFKEIYNHGEVQSLVVDVYQVIIKFIGFSCDYYQRSGILRVLSAIYDGPRVGLEGILRSMSHKEALVLKEVSVQLNKRVNTIYEAAEGQKKVLATIQDENLKLKRMLSESLQKQNESLQKQNESLQKQNISLTRGDTQDKLEDMTRLAKLSERLGFDEHAEPEIFSSTEWNRRKQKYSKEFEFKTRRGQFLAPISQSMLSAFGANKTHHLSSCFLDRIMAMSRPKLETHGSL